MLLKNKLQYLYLKTLWVTTFLSFPYSARRNRQQSLTATSLWERSWLSFFLRKVVGNGEVDYLSQLAPIRFKPAFKRALQRFFQLFILVGKYNGFLCVHQKHLSNFVNLLTNSWVLKFLSVWFLLKIVQKRESLFFFFSHHLSTISRQNLLETKDVTKILLSSRIPISFMTTSFLMSSKICFSIKCILACIQHDWQNSSFCSKVSVCSPQKKKEVFSLE